MKGIEFVKFSMLSLLLKCDNVACIWRDNVYSLRSPKWNTRKLLRDIVFVCFRRFHCKYKAKNILIPIIANESVYS